MRRENGNTQAQQGRTQNVPSTAPSTSSPVGGARTTNCDDKPSAGSPPAGSGSGYMSGSPKRANGAQDRIACDCNPNAAGSPPMGSGGDYMSGAAYNGPNEFSGKQRAKIDSVDMQPDLPNSGNAGGSAKFNTTTKDY